MQSSSGTDDELGICNIMSPYLINGAASSAKKCKLPSLEVVLDSNVPAFPAHSIGVTILQPGQVNCRGLEPT